MKEFILAILVLVMVWVCGIKPKSYTVYELNKGTREIVWANPTFPFGNEYVVRFRDRDCMGIENGDILEIKCADLAIKSYKVKK